ncbi:MAG: protein phosphatase 2C domain-containing protein [Micrococcales bacterium]|nr:protein phosphatase 2C domain-containing protein [Micrococcales bacterium]
MRTSWGSATHRGAVRAVNEDAALTYPPLFMVADGMGGHDAGDLAARITVEEFAQLTGVRSVSVDEIRAAFDRTSTRIRTEFTQGRRGGTTVAGVAITEQGGALFWLVFNIGDSRVYRWSAATGLTQVSVDHSVVQDLVDKGVLSREEADRHPERHVLTRALGTNGLATVDYWMLPVTGGDRMLVCTDGLTRELGRDEIAALLDDRPEPKTAAVDLVNEAVQRGARDNVTVVVVDMLLTDAELDQRHPTARRAGGTSATPGRGWDEMLDGATVPRRDLVEER